MGDTNHLPERIDTDILQNNIEKSNNETSEKFLATNQTNEKFLPQSGFCGTFFEEGDGQFHEPNPEKQCYKPISEEHYAADHETYLDTDSGFRSVHPLSEDIHELTKSEHHTRHTEAPVTTPAKRPHSYQKPATAAPNKSFGGEAKRIGNRTTKKDAIIPFKVGDKVFATYPGDRDGKPFPGIVMKRTKNPCTYTVKDTADGTLWTNSKGHECYFAPEDLSHDVMYEFSAKNSLGLSLLDKTVGKRKAVIVTKVTYKECKKRGIVENSEIMSVKFSHGQKSPKVDKKSILAAIKEFKRRYGRRDGTITIVFKCPPKK